MFLRLFQFIYKYFITNILNKSIKSFILGFSSMMPAQSGDPISSALHLSLSSSKKLKSADDLDSRLCDKQVLFSDIKYESTKCFNTNPLRELQNKYIVLSTVPCSSKSEEVTGSKDSVVINSSQLKKPVPCSKEPTSLPTPKVVLYSPDKVLLGWSKSNPVGSGFSNLGNTCYLNATLQALFHVPAFVNWLLGDSFHSTKCETMNGVTHLECLVCAMSKTLISSQKYTGSVVKPVQIYHKLKSICRHLTPGHQGDAHEFLRYLVEGMERSYLTIFNGTKLDNYSKETTPLNQIFGGYLRSEVTCLECKHVSTTFQHFQDLLLDIRTASSVDEALESFFSRERLGDGDQAYRCEQCKRRVAATKKFSIERPPKALCIALKRFGAMGGKNGKTISMKQILDISKFRHRPSPDSSCQYKLMSMVTHLGNSSSCGHYTAVGHTSSGSYYLFDDSLVRPIPIQNVLNSNPYILMYELETDTRRLPQPVLRKETNGFANSNGVSGERAGSSGLPSPSTNGTPHSPLILRDIPQGQKKPNYKLQFHKRPTWGPGSSNSSSPAGQSAQTSSVQQSSAASPSSSSGAPPPPPPPPSPSPIKQEASSSSDSKGAAPKETPRGGGDEVTADQEAPTTPQKKADSSSVSSQSPAQSSSFSSLSPKSMNNSISEESPANRRADAARERRQEETTPTKNSAVEKKSTPAEDKAGSTSTLSLVPYGSDASSESDSEFAQPESSPFKSHKSGVKGNSSPVIQNVKGVRIEVEGWESMSAGHHARPGNHSPAGSTSSGKWSVTSAERDKSPDKTGFTSTIVIEKGDRLTNGSTNGNGSTKERWAGDSRYSSSSPAVDHLMKTSHRGYGSQVKSWNGGRSEMDSQLDGERRYQQKRSHDTYNDDFDRGKAKKLKKYHGSKQSYLQRMNTFQDYQNRKNMWQGNGNQRHYMSSHYNDFRSPRYNNFSARNSHFRN